MISTPHHLPQVILELSEMESAIDLMAAARTRLAELDEQIRAFTLVAIFERNPSLVGFSFYLEDHFDDEGNAFSITHHQLETRDGELSSDELLSLNQDIDNFLADQGPSWLAERSELVFSRPAPGGSLADHLLRLCLGEAKFARWQAQSIAANADSASLAQPRASL